MLISIPWNYPTIPYLPLVDHINQWFNCCCFPKIKIGRWGIQFPPIGFWLCKASVLVEIFSLAEIFQREKEKAKNIIKAKERDLKSPPPPSLLSLKTNETRRRLFTFFNSYIIIFFFLLQPCFLSESSRFSFYGRQISIK